MDQFAALVGVITKNYPLVVGDNTNKGEEYHASNFQSLTAKV
jgi:hypothetical protein